MDFLRLKKDKLSVDKKVIRKKSRFEQLRRMDCFPIVLERIKRGVPLTDVCRFIVEESGEFDKLDVKTHESLRQLLIAFKKSLPTSEVRMLEKKENEKENKKPLIENFDEFEELIMLYLKQKERIEMETHTELNVVKKLFKGTGREISIAADILKALIDRKVEVGLLQRQPARLDISHFVSEEVAKEYGKTSIADVMLHPDSRKKVLGLVERFLGSREGVDKLINKIDEVDFQVVDDENDVKKIEEKKEEKENDS